MPGTKRSYFHPSTVEPIGSRNSIFDLEETFAYRFITALWLVFRQNWLFKFDLVGRPVCLVFARSNLKLGIKTRILDNKFAQKNALTNLLAKATFDVIHYSNISATPQTN